MTMRTAWMGFAGWLAFVTIIVPGKKKNIGTEAYRSTNKKKQEKTLQANEERVELLAGGKSAPPPVGDGNRRSAKQYQY